MPVSNSIPEQRICQNCKREYTFIVYPSNKPCYGKYCSRACKKDFYRNMPFADRFWPKVNKAEGDGCWLWGGTLDKDGYGRLGMATGGKIRMIRANRFSWELTFGPIPEGQHVLHECDNPPCVRPDHLFLGTNLDNLKDRDSKGRQAKGSKDGNSKLKEEQVLEIRSKFASGSKNAELAKEYGVCSATIYFITSRTTWKHV